MVMLRCLACTPLHIILDVQAVYLEPPGEKPPSLQRPDRDTVRARVCVLRLHSLLLHHALTLYCVLRGCGSCGHRPTMARPTFVRMEARSHAGALTWYESSSTLTCNHCVVTPWWNTRLIAYSTTLSRLSLLQTALRSPQTARTMSSCGWSCIMASTFAGPYKQHLTSLQLTLPLVCSQICQEGKAQVNGHWCCATSGGIQGRPPGAWRHMQTVTLVVVMGVWWLCN